MSATFWNKRRREAALREQLAKSKAEEVKPAKKTKKNEGKSDK